MLIATALLVCLQDPTIDIEGPPALVRGDSIELRANVRNAPEGSTVVWRVADAPGGVKHSITTVPAYEERSFTIRGTQRVALNAIGAVTGEGRVTAWVEKGGRRLATRDFLFALVEPVAVKARLRVVVHAKGGTRKGELWRDDDEVAKVAASVNKILRSCGVELDLGRGDDVKAADDLFDGSGVFQPITLAYGKKAKSHTLTRLLENDAPGAVNVYLVRDLHRTEPVAHGYASVKIEHTISGVGHSDGFVLLDDSADEETLAHEFGHVLGLEDLGEQYRAVEEAPDDVRRRLMFSIKRGRTGNGFTWDEFRTARRTAEKLAAKQDRAERNARPARTKD